MAEFPGFTIWTDAYLGDTGHLTTIEHGAYLLLLMTMWRAGGSLPNDDRKLAKYAKMTPSQWARVRPTIIDFFDVADEITQSRLTRELTFVRQRSERQSNNARSKSLKDNRTTQATAEPRLSQTQAPTPTPTLTVDTSLRSVEAQAPSKRKSGSRLSVDWQLPRAWGQWALDEVSGADVELIRSQADQFKDYWISKSGSGATKMDWEATWRNWMRKAAGTTKPRHQNLRGLALVDQQLREEIENGRNSGAESIGSESLPRLSFGGQR